jgi:hypothetical protein
MKDGRPAHCGAILILEGAVKISGKGAIVWLQIRYLNYLRRIVDPLISGFIVYVIFDVIFYF